MKIRYYYIADKNDNLVMASFDSELAAMVYMNNHYTAKESKHFKILPAYC